VTTSIALRSRGPIVSFSDEPPVAGKPIGIPGPAKHKHGEPKLKNVADEWTQIRNKGIDPRVVKESCGYR